MKFFKFAVVLLAFVGLSLIGCSDKSQSPVDPTDQSLQNQVSLQKNFSREFTLVAIPTGIDNPGILKYPDGKIMLKGSQGPVYYIATFPLSDNGPDILTGPGEIEINGMIDPVNGIGQFHGKLLLKPEASAAAGGVWEFTWHGESIFSLTAWEDGPGWTLTLRDVGHGNGGSLTGMQCQLELTVLFPPDMSAWTGTGNGVIYSH